MKMLIHELIHFIITFSIGIILSAYFGEPRLIFIVFITGMLVDADHLFDYFHYYRFHFSISKFFVPGLYFNKERGKVFIPFHGWEYLLLLFFLGNILEKLLLIQGISWALTLAYFGHLAFDQLTVTPTPFGYFFTYRLFNNFDLKKFNEKQ